MDHLWEVTIIPPVSSRTVPSNNATASSMRVLHIIKEHESKDGKESDDRMDKKINKENKHSQIYKGTNDESNNESSALFIELGAIYKILDFITDSDPKVSSLTNSCCNEIYRTLQCLIAQCHDKKLEDLLLNDSSLYRCERCGVISCSLGSHPATVEIKENGAGVMHGVGIMAAERDYINDNRDNEKAEISRGPSDLRNNMKSRTFFNTSEIDLLANYKDELKEIESLPIKERAFVMRNRIETSNGANNISDTETNANCRIKNTSHQNNNAIERLFANSDTTEWGKKYGFDSNDDPLIAMKVYTDKEEIVRKISYENKSRIDNLPAADRYSKGARKSQGLQLFEKDSNNYAIADTVKYLARGQYTIVDEKERDLLSRLHERRCIRLDNARRRQSSVLYGSRDDYPQYESGFWLFDKSGHLPEISSDEYRRLPISRLDNNDGSHAKVSQYPNTEKNSQKTVSWTECMEKDSLENSALLERRRESDTTTFSTSSAENLIHEWMRPCDGKEDIDDIDGDIRRGRKLVSSRASLDIARHIRAEMADENRRCDNAKKSMCEPRAHDSDVLIRLSPETRKKICHLIQKVVLSDSVKDTTLHREKCLTVNTLNSEKLSHPKSVDITSVRSDKSFNLGNEITDTCVDDCIPRKLSELLKDENRFITKQDNDVNACSQSMDTSKDCSKISHEREHLDAPVSFDKFGKIEVADNSLGKIVRRIIYKDISSKKAISNDDRYAVLAETFSIYRNILENSKDIDWDSFRELVEILHPDQKELWRDICKIVSRETRRAARDASDSTEVCIEIGPIEPEETLKTGKVTACTREIVFELDMTLKNVEGFLNKRSRLTEAIRLDIHKDADEGAVTG